MLRRTIRALLKANRFLEANRDETIRIMTQVCAAIIEIARRVPTMSSSRRCKDGTMTDAEIEGQMERLADKKRPLDEIRDFSFARQA